MFLRECSADPRLSVVETFFGLNRTGTRSRFFGLKVPGHGMPT